MSFQNRKNSISILKSKLESNFREKDDKTPLICLSHHNGIGKSRFLMEIPRLIKELQVSNISEKVFYILLDFEIIKNTNNYESIEEIFYSYFFFTLFKINIKFKKNSVIVDGDINLFIKSIISNDKNRFDEFYNVFNKLFETAYTENDIFSLFYSPIKKKLSGFSKIVLLIDEVANLADYFFWNFTEQFNKRKNSMVNSNFSYLNESLYEKIISLYYIWNNIFLTFQKNIFIELVVAGKNGFLPFMGTNNPGYNSPRGIFHLNLRSLNQNYVENIIKYDMIFNESSNLRKCLDLRKTNSYSENEFSINEKKFEELSKFVYKTSAGHPRLLSFILNYINVKLQDTLLLEFNENLENELLNTIDDYHIVNYNTDLFNKNNITISIKQLILLGQLDINLYDLKDDLIKIFKLPKNVKFQLKEILILIGFNFDEHDNHLKVYIPSLVLKKFISINNINERDLFGCLVNKLFSFDYIEPYDRLSELMVAINCRKILKDVNKKRFLGISKKHLERDDINNIEVIDCITLNNIYKFHQRLIKKIEAKNKKVEILIPKANNSICFDIIIIIPSNINQLNIIGIDVKSITSRGFDYNDHRELNKSFNNFKKDLINHKVWKESNSKIIHFTVSN